MARARERARGQRDAGLGLVAQFALLTGAALLVVGAGAIALLHGAAREMVQRAGERSLDRAVALTAQNPDVRRLGESGSRVGAVERFPVEVRGPGGQWEPARMVQSRAAEGSAPLRVLAPADEPDLQSAFERLVLGVVLAFVLIGAGLAALVAGRVTRPIRELTAQVRQIALGDLRYRSRVRSGGEVGELARSLERLAEDLAAAQEAELELSMRERELELAGEVREALLPLATPLVPGYDLGAIHVAAPLMGGGLFDWIEDSKGGLGVLVCDVAGKGLPAALFGAAARSTLRAALTREGDPRAALVAANRELARDVRRGMYVTALYARLDPARHQLEVWCAGHRLPLLLWRASQRRAVGVQPEGLALGLDPGPVFERSLSGAKVELSPGDRLLMAGSGAAEWSAPDGEEFGEARLARELGRLAALETPAFLKGLRQALENHGDGEPAPREFSLATLRREDGP